MDLRGPQPVPRRGLIHGRGGALTTFEPELFGKYYLVDRIATGGMAEVFRAKTFAVGGFESLFVVKRILAHLGEDPEFVSMFVDEAKISVLLQHPNIVRVFDFGKVGPHFFIAMEHVEGRDLHKVLRAAAAAGVAVPPEVAAWVVSEASKGLHFAHTRTEPDGAPLGIVHRDISPANLLVGVEGDVKVADFGIAKAESNAQVTDSGVLKGKYAYMSPEQAHGAAVDARSDVFALGVVLYELLTGRRAFKADDDEETLRRIREVELAPPRQVAPELPEALEAVVLRALAASPDDRFQSARELGEALRQAVPTERDDALRERFARWLEPLIGPDVAADRARVDAGAKVAAAMHEEAGRAEVAGAVHAHRQGRLVGMLAVGLVAMLLLLVGVIFMKDQRPQVPEVAIASRGALEIDVTPAAKVFVSGRPVGEGAVIAVPDLAPGDYEVRLEAEGHLPIEEVVQVTQGGVTRLRRALVAGLGEDAPVVRFRTRPTGARVLVDGEEIGRTPVDWQDGWPDRTYQVRFVLDEHVEAGTVIEGLGLREVLEVSRTLKPVQAEAPADAPKPPASTEERPAAASGGTGTLRVVLTGATWANVWVDGRKLDRTAPFSGLSVPVGRHTIRVENTGLGLDHTETVDVSADGSATVRAVIR